MQLPLKRRLPAAILTALLICVFSGLSGCVTHSEDVPTLTAILDEKSAVRFIPPGISDKEGWAEDIVAAIRMIEKDPTIERVCAVVAVIRQESGFQKDPAVSNLPKIVRDGLNEKFSSLGPLASPAVSALLSGSAPGSKESFESRINKLRTEKDLDRMFRDIEAAYRGKLPGTFAVAGAISFLLGKGSLRDLNPVTTAGSMQVKVSFAQEQKGNSELSDADVREQLYTRAGGIRYGTARLLGYSASYDDIIYRFADYNAGLFASRNAAVQNMLSDLTAFSLTEDGDLLSYDSDGDVSAQETQSLKALLSFASTHDYSAWTAKRDARKEKSIEFEETTTWKELRAAWEKKKGKVPAYAKLPNVELNSPKLRKTRSTEWFAKSVKKHYLECRARE
ncbi:MAG: DUF1615 family protein [Proteobacteria bacterium]|nr:MAG: DUF1615 family protein [Pseudomonadota bacterium]